MFKAIKNSQGAVTKLVYSSLPAAIQANVPSGGAMVDATTQQVQSVNTSPSNSTLALSVVIPVKVL